MLERLLGPVILAACLALLSACSGDEPPIEDPDSGIRVCDDACFAAAPPVGTYLVDTLTLAYPDPTTRDVVAGMNLDDRVSARTDEETCRQGDATSPPPDSEEGVDNVYGPAFASLFGTDASDYAPSISDGLVLLVLDVREDDLGRYVELFAVRTMDGGPPAFSGGTLAPDQTFVPLRSLGRAAGAPGGDRTRMGPTDLAMPISPLSGGLVMMGGARLYGDIGADGIERGVIGGAFVLEDAIPALVAIDPDAFSESLVRSVLAAVGDLSPDESGECRRASAGWTFTAIAAELAP